MRSCSRMTLPPRVLVVSGEQWPRALLRAQLGEAGYDAIGADTLSRALRQPPDDATRGPVRLVVVDSGAAGAEPEALQHARRRFPGGAFVLVHRAGAVPPGPWAAMFLTIFPVAMSQSLTVPSSLAEARTLESSRKVSAVMPLLCPVRE